MSRLIGDSEDRNGYSGVEQLGGEGLWGAETIPIPPWMSFVEAFLIGFVPAIQRQTLGFCKMNYSQISNKSDRLSGGRLYRT